MEKNDDRQSSSGGGGCCGSEEAEPEMARGIDDGVGRYNGVNGFRVGRSLEIEKAKKTFIDGTVSGESGVSKIRHERYGESCFPREGGFCNWLVKMRFCWIHF